MKKIILLVSILVLAGCSDLGVAETQFVNYMTDIVDTEEAFFPYTLGLSDSRYTGVLAKYAFGQVEEGVFLGAEEYEDCKDLQDYRLTLFNQCDTNPLCDNVNHDLYQTMVAQAYRKQCSAFNHLSSGEIPQFAFAYSEGLDLYLQAYQSLMSRYASQKESYSPAVQDEIAASVSSFVRNVSSNTENYMSACARYLKKDVFYSLNCGESGQSRMMQVFREMLDEESRLYSVLCDVEGGNCRNYKKAVKEVVDEYPLFVTSES